MRYHDEIYTASVHSQMAEGNEIYQALRDTFRGKIGGFLHIIIHDPQHDNELVRLHYQALKEGREYLVTTSSVRMQGAGTASPATQKTAANLSIIMGHWELTDASLIFPPSIAPRVHDNHGRYPTTSNYDTLLEDPYRWPNRFCDELRRLSSRSENRHADAMHLLLGVVQARHEREEHGVRQVTTGDIRIAVQRRIQQLADLALAEMPEEKEATQTFAGGMGESLAEIAQMAVEEGDEEIQELTMYDLKTTLVDWESFKRTT
ncbi:hypothetical protein BKA66DRAFT_567687 [Pyrenochaeta sp. MPI-SDFR-AT-0127]|nr:hypothetical protein BKA66DRAFT_567687 [Pyrenochaeta sp. MPI-SDFR-AT-0127]